MANNHFSGTIQERTKAFVKYAIPGFPIRPHPIKEVPLRLFLYSTNISRENTFDRSLAGVVFVGFTRPLIIGNLNFSG
jgi:hypothetical protein